MKFNLQKTWTNGIEKVKTKLKQSLTLGGEKPLTYVFLLKFICCY